MNHHLQRLVARSRGELAVVQPRIPARFEVAGAAAHAPPEVTQTTVPASASWSPPQALQSAATPPVSAPEPAATQHAILHRFAPATDPSHGIAGELLAAAWQPAASDMQRPRPDPIGSAQDAPSSRPAAGLTDPPTNAMQPPPAPIQPPPSATAPWPVAARAAHATAPPRVASEHHETVVRVTIGRVDVRAVAVAAPITHAPAPPAPARRSLDDYLRGSPRR